MVLICFKIVLILITIKPSGASPGDTGFFSTIPMPIQYCQILHNCNTIQYNAICLNIAYNAPQYRLKRIYVVVQNWKLLDVKAVK